MLSDRVFQSILPLNDRELCPYEEIFIFGIWRRFLFSSQLISLVVKNSVKTAGPIYLVHLYISIISFFSSYYNGPLLLPIFLVDLQM